MPRVKIRCHLGVSQRAGPPWMVSQGMKRKPTVLGKRILRNTHTAAFFMGFELTDSGIEQAMVEVLDQIKLFFGLFRLLPSFC